MAIKLHNLKGTRKTSAKKRVGRGNASGKGTYAGRGLKGQRSRSGGKKGLKKRSLMKQLIKKTPKYGGFKSIKKSVQTLTLRDLDSKFSQGDTVNLKSLVQKRMIKPKQTLVKIVATGKLTKKLIIKNIPCSKQAAQELEAFNK